MRTLSIFRHALRYVPVLCLAAIASTAVGEERFLQGRVVLVGTDDQEKPALGADVMLERDLPARKVQSNGLFVLWLSPYYQPGETLTLQVDYEGYAVSQPLGGEIAIPSDPNKQTVSVRLLPKGAPQLLNKAVIEKLVAYAARRSKEQVQLKGRPTQIDFNRYIKEWASQYGFRFEPVKTELDKWVASIDPRKGDGHKAALAEFMKKNFDRASKYATDSAVNHEKRLRQGPADAEQRRAHAVRDYRLAGDAHYNNYRFGEAMKSYQSALAHVTQDQLPLQWAAIQDEIGRAALEIALRAEGDAAQNHLEVATSAFRAVLTACPPESLCGDWGSTQSNLGIALRQQSLRIKGTESLMSLAQAVQAFRAASDYRFRARILDAHRSRGQGELSREAIAWRIYAVQAFRAALDIHGQESQSRASSSLGRAFLEETERDYADVLRLYPEDEEVQEVLRRLESVYQDELFEYAKAFELNSRRAKLSATDLGPQVEFAEKHLTTARYQDAMAMTSVLIDSREISESIKCGLRAIRIAALVGASDFGNASTEVNKLIENLREQPKDFQVSWTFSGTKHFIETHPDFADTKVPLLEIFSALEMDSRDAILDKLKAIDPKALNTAVQPG